MNFLQERGKKKILSIRQTSGEKSGVGSERDKGIRTNRWDSVIDRRWVEAI
jgi:hypothetical protein